MRWTEDKLRTQFPAKVREERRAEGLDPDVRPSQEWLRDHGYSGIESFASRNDMTVVEVLEDICGFEPRTPKPLGVDHPETRRLLKEWLDNEDEVFGQWDDRRIQDARTHIRTLAEVAYEEWGDTNLLRLCQADEPVAAKLIMRLFSGLANRLETQGAQSNYTRTLERWADYLVLMGEIDDHRIDQARSMMGYEYERKSPEHTLTVEQIRACWRAAETLEERAVVIALTVSGIRRAEPTDIQVDDLRLDRDDPYIVFDATRKTGAATVPIMAGAEVLNEWIEHLKDLEYWDGKWLFPSQQSRDGSRPPGWVNNVIEELVERAGVTFPDGEKPTPKSFRAFWYSHYMEARQTWLAQVEQLADEQGVASSTIIDLHYLTGKGERDHFRKFAQSYFAAVFGDDLLHGIDSVLEVREEERDELVQMTIDDYFDDLRDELIDATHDDDDEADADGEDNDSVHESPVVSDPITAWTRARLQIEHAAAAASDVVDGYPPTARGAVAIGVGLSGWAVLVGTLWGLSGAAYIDPFAGRISATPGTIIGLLLGLLLVITDLPDFDTVNL